MRNILLKVKNLNLPIYGYVFLVSLILGVSMSLMGVPYERAAVILTVILLPICFWPVWGIKLKTIKNYTVRPEDKLSNYGPIYISFRKNCVLGQLSEDGSGNRGNLYSKFYSEEIQGGFKGLIVPQKLSGSQGFYSENALDQSLTSVKGSEYAAN